MTSIEQAKKFELEGSVYSRYAAAAGEVEPALCCPVDYSSDYLAVIPQEVIDRDYGCGDPTPYVRTADTVLDLGSGGGKACYIVSQIVGSKGHVIGVDCNDEMLSLARRHRDTVAQRLGYSNVEFRRGLIQDLQLNLDRLGEELAREPVHDHRRWLELRGIEDQLRRDEPLVADESIDCVISNCVLNLVRPQDRGQLFQELFRVLRRGGRVVISDIAADEDVPERMQQDPKLWSGCISGAYREDQFLKAFEEAGFHGIQIVKRQTEPWRTVEGIEFRSVTIMAYKGKQGPCLERNQALIYRGPFRKVEDDDGHAFDRGESIAVCDRTFQLLQREPYVGLFEPITPREPISVDEAQKFDCGRSERRHARETKGLVYDLTTTEPEGPCCDPAEPCC